MNAITPIVAVSVAAPEPAVLWAGRPKWSACAVRIWKVRWAAAWFALLLADGGRMAFAAAPAARATAWSGEQRLLAAALVGLCGLVLLGYLTRRTTRYEVGPTAVTLRYGIALAARLVVPLAAISEVAVRTHADGTGDVALRLKPGKGLIYPKLWPHARPWRLLKAEPMLRCVPDAGVAAAILCRALAARDAEARALSLPSRG